MKKIFILFLFSFSVQAQVYYLENNPNWNKYQVVVEKNIKNNSERIFQLQNGKVSVLKTFYNNELNNEIKLNYDEKSNIQSLEVKFPNKEAREEDFVDFELKYNKQGLKIEDKNHKYIYDKKNHLIQRFTKLFEESNGTKSWSESYFYNDDGDLIRTEKTVSEKGIQIIDVECFSYDACKNIIKIQRSSTPERNYPIIILGGEMKNQVEIYEYEYNEDCIWVKKFVIADDSKTLMVERDLIK